MCSNCHRKFHAGIIQLPNIDLCNISFERWYELVPRNPRKSLSKEAIIIRKRERAKIGHCNDCGEKCSKDASRCIKCYNIAKRTQSTINNPQPVPYC